MFRGGQTVRLWAAGCPGRDVPWFSSVFHDEYRDSNLNLAMISLEEVLI
jgi:hypothetical protein